jgi:hypothetical protein
MRSEDRPDQSFGTGSPRLRLVIRAFQQATTRNAELPSDRAGEHLTLVEPALTSAPSGRRRPGDDIDIMVEPSLHEAVDDQPGEVPTNCPTVAVLPAQYDPTSTTRERHGRHDSVLGIARSRAHQSEATGRTDG